jgi:hypothetical protein
MYNIALIGAGQLGSRHLQGLAKIQFLSKIYVIDPDVQALELARDRYHEMGGNLLVAELLLKTSIDELPQQLDLVIVATNSNIRAAIIKSVLSKCAVRNFIFEKILFQKEKDYFEISELLKQKGINAWVNCPRRLFNGFRLLKELFSKNEPIFLSVTGGNWGLGCNSIHFIDLFAFITEDYDIELSMQFLSPVLLESKRSGFKEFAGTLIGKQKSGSTIILNSDSLYNGNESITIRGNHAIAIIDEAVGKINMATEWNSWKWDEIKVEAKYQSLLTGSVASEIIATNSCGLSTFEDSVQLHVPFIRTFLNFYNSIASEKLDACPIT